LNNLLHVSCELEKFIPLILQHPSVQEEVKEQGLGEVIEHWIVRPNYVNNLHVLLEETGKLELPLFPPNWEPAAKNLSAFLVCPVIRCLLRSDPRRYKGKSLDEIFIRGDE